jgi:hypothetical protein
LSEAHSRSWVRLSSSKSQLCHGSKCSIRPRGLGHAVIEAVVVVGAAAAVAAGVVGAEVEDIVVAAIVGVVVAGVTFAAVVIAVYGLSEGEDGGVDAAGAGAGAGAGAEAAEAGGVDGAGVDAVVERCADVGVDAGDGHSESSRRRRRRKADAAKHRSWSTLSRDRKQGWTLQYVLQ